MTTIPGHKHVTEREGDGSFEDCTWCSGVEWLRDCFDPSIPATHAEAEALRHDSGEPATGGSNLWDLRKGVKARYGIDLPAALFNGSTLSALKPGMAAVLQGSMSAFGPDHRLSQYDRNFDGGHAVYVANVNGAYLWCDPEAPTGANVPVVVSAGELTRFIDAFAGQVLVAPILAFVPKELPVDLVTFLPGYTANVKSGSNVRLAPSGTATKVHATTEKLAVQVIGTVVGTVDPLNGSNVWYALWHVADKRVEYTAKDNVVDLAAPTDAIVIPAWPDVRAALALAESQLAAANAKLDIAAPKAAALDAFRTALAALLP